MNYTVTWRPWAESELAEAWVNAPDRSAVTRAAANIDQALAYKPLAVGESRFGCTRVLFDGPLAVYYDVIEDDRKVVIWKVWRC